MVDVFELEWVKVLMLVVVLLMVVMLIFLVLLMCMEKIVMGEVCEVDEIDEE